MSPTVQVVCAELGEQVVIVDALILTAVTFPRENHPCTLPLGTRIDAAGVRREAQDS